MRWLITGGCGFIGTRLVDALSRQGDQTVRVVDNLSEGRIEDLAAVARYRVTGAASIAPMSSLGPGTVEFVEGDVCDAELARNAAAGAQIIVHLAAAPGVQPSVENPRFDCRTNVMGTLNYLEAARQDDVRRFVYASSGAPVFFGEPPVDESMAPKPASPYGASKLSGEAYCSAYFHSFGVETVALRFGNVYGPGSGHKSSVVATFIRNALAGEMLEIHGDGRQTRDFIHVEDLSRAIKLAATVPAIGGEVFQIATNVETTIAGILNKMLQILATYGIRETQLRHVAARRRQAQLFRYRKGPRIAGLAGGGQAQRRAEGDDGLVLVASPGQAAGRFRPARPAFPHRGRRAIARRCREAMPATVH